MVDAARVPVEALCDRRRVGEADLGMRAVGILGGGALRYLHPRFGYSIVWTSGLRTPYKTFCLMMALLATSRALSAQVIAADELNVRRLPYTPGVGYAFQADANMVEVGAVVRDRLGIAVPGLQKEDFHILENGVQYPITQLLRADFRRRG